MAEVTADLRSLPKARAYDELVQQTESILAGLTDPIVAMATISALVYHGFGHLWAGFYRVVDDGTMLRVGPYQGTLGCLEIRVGLGVCGTCAERRATVVVPDVEAFPGHIACDALSRSEIVVPVFDHRQALIAVFDIDSTQPAAFDDVDARQLERVVSWFARTGTTP